MEIFEILQIFRLMHDVNHSFYIILIIAVSLWHIYVRETTDCALNVFADLVLNGWRSAQRTDSAINFHYDSKCGLWQMTRAYDTCRCNRWLRSCQRRRRLGLLIFKRTDLLENFLWENARKIHAPPLFARKLCTSSMKFHNSMQPSGSWKLRA